MLILVATAFTFKVVELPVGITNLYQSMSVEVLRSKSLMTAALVDELIVEEISDAVAKVSFAAVVS